MSIIKNGNYIESINELQLVNETKNLYSIMTTYNLYSNNKIILRQTKNYSVYLTLTDSNIFLFNNFAQFTSFKNFELVLEKIDGLVLVDLKNSYTKLFNTFLKENKLENIVISKTPYISTNGNSLTLILLDLKKKKQKKK